MNYNLSGVKSLKEYGLDNVGAGNPVSQAG